MNLSELLTAFRAEKDVQDILNADLAASRKRADELEQSILAEMERNGFDSDGSKFSDGGMTVTRRTKWRAKYDPALWPQIVAWANESGNSHIIQRRLSDKPVMELIDCGVALPEGLSAESYVDLDFRRS